MAVNIVNGMIKTKYQNSGKIFLSHKQIFLFHVCLLKRKEKKILKCGLHPKRI